MCRSRRKPSSPRYVWARSKSSPARGGGPSEGWGRGTRHRRGARLSHAKAQRREGDAGVGEVKSSPPVCGRGRGRAIPLQPRFNPPLTPPVNGRGTALAFSRPRDTLTDMNALSPIVSEFASEEDAAAYAEWLKRKIAASLADGREPVAHDEVMAQAQAIIDSRKS